MFKKQAPTYMNNIATSGSSLGVPMIPMHPQTLAAIKRSRKGKLPAGLAKYLAAKRKGK